MEEKMMTLTAQEAAEYGEFKRFKRETEISFTLKRLIVDASRRETDKNTLKNACETARNLNADSVLVSPLNVASAKRILEKSEVKICCLVGGTGESLIATKRYEAKRAVKHGAHEVRLILSYGALNSGNAAYLRKELKRVRRAVKKSVLTISLEDHSLTSEQIATACRAAREARANGVTVRGDMTLALRAIKEGAGKLKVDCSGVENSEQLRSLVKAGVQRASTRYAQSIAQELYVALCAQFEGRKDE